METRLGAATGCHAGCHALVIVAGNDIWPPLRALAAYAADWPEGFVFVFRAADIPGVADNVEIIRRFCSRCWPRLKMVIPASPGSNSADSIVGQMADWKHFHPEISSWQVEASGAPSLTLQGLARVVAGDKSVRVIVRDGHDNWLEAGDGSPTPCLTFSPMRQPIPPDSLDHVPLIDLMTPFCGAEAELLWRESRDPEALGVTDLASIIAAGVKCNWAWRSMYETALQRPCPQAEYGLKDFIGSVLTSMGVMNARVDVRIVWSARKEEPLSLDVVACRHGRLFLFDCHTVGEDRAEGVRAATQDAARKLLRQMEVVCVVMRPTRWATGAERLMELAAPTAHLMDVDACRNLFSRLAAVLGVRVPAELRALERGALCFQATRLPVLSAASSAQRLGDAVHVDDRIFDLVRGARVDDAHTSALWRAARVTPDTWFVEGRVMRGGPPMELRTRLESRFEAERVKARVVFFELSPNQRYWHALLRVSGEPSHFSRRLHAWRKLPLIV